MTARNSAEEAVTVGIKVKGLVDGVDMSGDVPVLLVNGTRFNVDDVSEIRTAQLEHAVEKDRSSARADICWRFF